MDINLDEVKDIDLTGLKEEFIRGPIREGKHSFGYREKAFLGKPGKEHYRLLAYLSTKIDNGLITDIGTYRGYSAVALSYNQTNKVISFDINRRERETSISRTPDNVEFRYDNVLSKQHHKELLESGLIFLDAGHDGWFENEVHKFLIKHKYEGLMLVDDITLIERGRRESVMNNWWTSIKDAKTYDLTKVGHGELHRGKPCGTGLIDYSGKVKIKG